MDANEFDFYSHLKVIIKELEEKDDYDDNVILKRLIYLTSCEVSSCFLDNVFVSSKLKFISFDNNKKYSKAMLDMLYQILKVFNAFQYKSVVNLFETLALGNFGTDDMVYFLKVLFTFYFTHELTMLSLLRDYTVYETLFKEKFKEGLEKMKGIIRAIPLIVLLNTDDEEYIATMFRIHNDDSKRSNSTLPPVKPKHQINVSNNSGIFSTSISKVKHEAEMSKNNTEGARSEANSNYQA